jgi:hypothetical protein
MQIGDKIISKKTHPCGGNEWEVIRVGADFKLKCTTCGHVIMVDSQKLKKMRK